MTKIVDKIREWLRPHIPPPVPLPASVDYVEVDTPEGHASSIAGARQEMLEARQMGAANLFGVHRERTALEALVSELRNDRP